MKNPYMIGQKVYLRAPTKKDALGSWHEWFSDEETTKYVVDRFWPNSPQAQLEFLRSAHHDHSRLLLSVVTIAEDRHIGVVSLNAINWVHRFADIAIVIGNKDYRKGVYAIEAFSLMLKAAFERLNLLYVRGGYVSLNEGSGLLMRLFKFSEAGVWRRLMKIDGQECDAILMSLTRDQWEKQQHTY